MEGEGCKRWEGRKVVKRLQGRSLFACLGGGAHWSGVECIFWSYRACRAYLVFLGCILGCCMVIN